MSALPPDLKAQFPGLAGDWHYLDTGATAQKPQAVIDATVRAMGADYATVHRGVYARSAEMTLAFEGARAKVAAFIGGKAEELVFTRGATEAINLVAQTWGAQNLRAGDRVLLSTLEHHSNIVPWQLLAQRQGFAIDVCPLTHDGRIDLDAAEALLTPAHKLVSLAHVCVNRSFVNSKEKPTAFVGQETYTCDDPVLRIVSGTTEAVMKPMSSMNIERLALFVKVTLAMDSPLGATNPKNVSPWPAASLITRLALTLLPPLKVAVPVTSPMLKRVVERIVSPNLITYSPAMLAPTSCKKNVI